VKEKLDNAVKDAANKPKGWIANKIYSFRQLYKSYLDKANREHDSGKIGFFKNIARMILSCIDKLAKFLQNATDSRSFDEKKQAMRDKVAKETAEKHKDFIDKTSSETVNKTMKILQTKNKKDDFFDDGNARVFHKFAKERNKNNSDFSNHPKYGDLNNFDNFDKFMKDPSTTFDF
jgi:hypothetical protein